MKDVKVVAYGAIDQDDERLIRNYLEEKDMTVRIISIDSSRNLLAVAEARVLELEELIAIAAEERPLEVGLEEIDPKPMDLEDPEHVD